MRQYELQRLPIIAELHRKGYSYRKIAAELSLRFKFDKPISLATVHKDITTLLKEWRDTRISETDLNMEDQLSQIDYAVEELWQQWEKSKTDYQAKSVKKKAEIQTKAEGSEGAKTELTPSSIEDSVKNELMLGDPRYIAEIRAQLAEKRKLLGLYAPEKKDITSNGKALGNDFYSFLKKVNQTTP